MNDQSKTKHDLIQELVSLRKRIAERSQYESEHKQVEESLRESEDKYRSLIENIPDIIFIAIDLEGKITFISKKIKEILGYEDAETINMNIFNFIPKEDQQRAMETLQKGMKGEKTKHVQLPVTAKSGEKLFFDFSFSRIYKDGVVVGAQGTAVDVTERKRAEAALKQSEESIHAITDFAHDAIMMMDNNGNISYWNPAAELILGYTSSEAIGRNLHELITPERFLPAHLAAFPEFQKTGQGNAIGKTLELAARRKDGREIDVALSLSAVKIKGAWHAVGILQDITERKLAEKYREMSNEILQILSKPGTLRDSIQSVLTLLKTRTGFDAIGIRLRDGNDFPYFAQNGFSNEFLLTENSLIARSMDGGVCRDKDGNICLECTCGLVISGKTDPASPLFTKGGSAWTNDSFPLLDLPPDQDPRLNPRNQCIHQGYASVALVPIRSKDSIIGLIQFNDRRKNCFSLAAIEQFESIAANIGEALLRMDAEEALRESEDRYRVLVENASDMIFRTDVNGNFTFVNPAVIHIVGYGKEELIGKQYTTLIRSDMRDNANKFFGRQIVKGIQNTYSEYPIITKDGQELWLGQNTQLIVKDGKVTGFQVVSRDITELKRMGEKLRFEEQRFRAFVEHASDMIVLVNPEGVILYVNQAIENILGYKPEERIGANGGEIVHPDDVKALAEVFITLSTDTSSPVINRELRLRHKDGSWRTLEATGSNLVNNNVVESIIINYRDITERKKAEDALRKSEEKFKQLAEVFPETIFEANMKGDVTYANEHGLKQFGLTQKDIVSGINIFDLVSPLDRNLAMERIQTRIKDSDNSEKKYLEYKAVKKDGSTFYAMALSVPIMVDGVPAGIRGFILDITERRQAENMLYESEERYRLIAENTADTIAVFDLNLKPTYVSPSMLKLRGYTVEEAMTQTLDQILTPDSLQQANKHFADQMALELSGTADPTRTVLMELEEYCKDGSTIFVELAASFLRDKNLKPTGILTVTRDITQRKKAEEQIQYLATHDLLTDLPSLRFARDRLSVALNMARRYKKAVAVMFIDLDGFKDVNDTFGHDIGDYVLQQVAKRLLSCVRETDTVTRFGGDEFLIIATEINTPENAAQIAEKVIQMVSQPIIFNGRQSVVSASIGIALFPDDGQDIDQLIKKADEAMYIIKKAGKNGFCFIRDTVN